MRILPVTLSTGLFSAGVAGFLVAVLATGLISTGVAGFLAACKKIPETGGSGGAGTAQAAGKPPVEGELVVTAILKEIAGPFPANDIYNYAYVMHYEVAKVHQGTYADKDILVGHYNPRFARAEVKDDQDAKVGGNVKSFQVGDAHYLVLSPLDGVWNGAIEDAYYKDKRARHWALWADMASAD